MTVCLALQTKEGNYLIADRKHTYDDSTFYLASKIDKIQDAVFATAGDVQPWLSIKKILKNVDLSAQNEDYFLYGGMYDLIKEQLFGKIAGQVEGFVAWRGEIVSFHIDFTESKSSAGAAVKPVSALGSGAADTLATIKAFNLTTKWDTLKKAKEAIKLVSSYNGTISSQLNVVKL